MARSDRVQHGHFVYDGGIASDGVEFDSTNMQPLL